MAPSTHCACGRPLHYQSPQLAKLVDLLSRELGPTVRVITESGSYSMQRHYLALHGVKAAELPALAARGIVRKED